MRLFKMWFYKVICSKIYVLKKVMKRRNYEKIYLFIFYANVHSKLRKA